MTAFLTSTAPHFGLTLKGLRDAIKKGKRARQNGDEREAGRVGYKPRPWRLEKTAGKSLKRIIREAMVANDLAKVLARLGGN